MEDRECSNQIDSLRRLGQTMIIAMNYLISKSKYL